MGRTWFCSCKISRTLELDGCLVKTIKKNSHTIKKRLRVVPKFRLVRPCPVLVGGPSPGGSGPWHTSCSEGGTELLDQLPPQASTLELRMHRHTHLKVRTAVVNDGNAVVSPFGWKGRYHVVSNHVKLIHISQFAQTSDFRNFKTFDPNRRLSFVPTGDSFVRRDPPKGDSHTSQGLFRLGLFQATPQGLLEQRGARGVCDAHVPDELESW